MGPPPDPLHRHSATAGCAFISQRETGDWAASSRIRWARAPSLVVVQRVEFRKWVQLFDVQCSYLTSDVHTM